VIYFYISTVQRSMAYLLSASILNFIISARASNFTGQPKSFPSNHNDRSPKANFSTRFYQKSPQREPFDTSPSPFDRRVIKIHLYTDQVVYSTAAQRLHIENARCSSQKVPESEILTNSAACP
jgi:hypothetical protein